MRTLELKVYTYCNNTLMLSAKNKNKYVNLIMQKILIFKKLLNLIAQFISINTFTLCRIKVPFCRKDFPQNWHICGFSPLWISMWASKVNFRLKYLAQMGH